LLRRACAVVSLLLAGGPLVPASVPAAASRIDVTVREPAGIARRGAPVTIGIPLAMGRFASGSWVFDPPAAGSQWRVVERWPDGSARWLLLDAEATVAAHGSQVVTLGDAPPAPITAQPIVVARDDAGIRMQTGKITVTVRPRGSALATIERQGVAAPLAVSWPRLVVDGQTMPPPLLESVSVETSGGIRAETLVRARQDNGLAHDVRIAAFAGHAAIRIRYTLTHLGDAPYLALSALPLELASPSTTAELAIDGKARAFVLAGANRRHVVTHHEAQAALLDGKPAGRHADGFARVAGDDGVWSVALPDFWQEYPKSLTVENAGIRVDLAAAAHDPLQFGVGAARTWEIWIAGHGQGSPPRLVDLGRSLTRPPLAGVSGRLAAASGAAAYAVDPALPAAAAFLTRLRGEIDRYRARAMAERWDDGPPGPCATRTVQRPHLGFYGALNWGDWNFPGFRDGTKGCDAWGNLEYDLPLVLGLTYLATGDAEVWHLFDAAARHYRDVDIIHRWPGFEVRVGLNHPHKVRHFATDATNTFDLGHVWLDGLLLHYRLTGEERSREAVVRMADALLALPDRARNPRQFGWPMVALAAAFEATADARYRAACLAFASKAAARFPPDANAEWKMGVLAEGMAAAHRATGDAGVRRWLDDYGRQLLAPPPRPRDPRLVSPAGYLAALAGEPRLAELAEQTARTLEVGNWGKPLAAMGRVGFALLAPLSRAALTPGRAAPPPGSAPAPPPR
jgi:hypothetical protein